MTDIEGLREKLPAAIKTTEYKYFGDYEMTEGQRAAVDTLVDAAQALPTLLDELTHLRTENATLSAGACIYPNGDGLIGDERGNAVCAKDAEIERLRAERDEAYKGATAAEWRAIAISTQAALAEARGALAPFSAYATSVLKDHRQRKPESKHIDRVEVWISYGDLRRAASVFEKLGGE